MKFLSRRMVRQKVNGNGIRSAGNPDEEPVLSRFPVCPPVLVGIQGGNSRKAVNKQQDLPLYSNACSDHPASNGAINASAFESSHLAALGRAGLDAVKSRPEQEISAEVVDDSSHHLTDPVFRSKNGLQASFPLKLQRILDKFEAESNIDVLSWQPHGRAFIVHDSDRFVNEVLPVYFNQTKYSSFQRQCHMYNFTRITHAGSDKGAYFNVNFQRGRPELSMKMQRTRVNGNGTRRPGNPDQEPDLCAMPPLPAIEPGTTIEIPLDFPSAVALTGLVAVGEGNTSGSTSGDED